MSVKDPRVIQDDGDHLGGHFRIPAESFDPLIGFRRKVTPRTPEQREANTARLAAAREAKNRV